MVGITILDGGMGKELRRMGAPFGQPEWSARALMEAPETVSEAHGRFIDAGAQVITTNTYAVVPFHLGAATVAEHGAALIELAGRLARDAADGADSPVRVAGSLPPVFGSYRPWDFDATAARPYTESAVRHLDPFVDIWLVETIGCIAEMRVYLDALAATDRPIWVSFTLTDDDGGVLLYSGETLEDAARAVAASPPRIDALLCNCAPPETISRALPVLGAALGGHGCDVRLGAYANAFPVDRPDDYRANRDVMERREDLTPERYADVAAGWIDAGATIVGGCCDIHPEHVAELTDRFGGASAQR